MKTKNRLLASIAIIALGATGIATAGNVPGAVTLTFGDAYYHYSPKRDVDNSSMPNFELAYNASQHWAIEGTFGVLNTQQTASAGDEHVHGFLYTIDGLYRFTPYKIIEPYATAGIGVIGVKPTETDATQQGCINAGVGAQFFFAQPLALRTEIRDVYTTTGSAFNDFFVNFAISYVIGGEKPESAYKN